MASRPDAPVDIELPSAADDRPAWRKIGLLALVGFAVGLAWPRWIGVRLGPSPPESSSAVARGEAPLQTEGNLPAALVAPASSTPLAPAKPEAPAQTEPPPAPMPIQVGRGVVLSCRTSDGEVRKGQACGGLKGLDGLVRERLKELNSCPAAQAAEGKLSVMLGLDFAGPGKARASVGRSSSVANPGSIAPCLNTIVSGMRLGSVDRTHPAYTVNYAVTWGPPAAGGRSARPEGRREAASSVDASSFQVVSDVALVRERPNGPVVQRLVRGTRVRVGPIKDGWYPVLGGPEGWVHRANLAR